MTRRQNIRLSIRKNRRMEGTEGGRRGEGAGRERGRLFNQIGKPAWRGRDLQLQLLRDGEMLPKPFCDRTVAASDSCRPYFECELCNNGFPIFLGVMMWCLYFRFSCCLKTTSRNQSPCGQVRLGTVCPTQKGGNQESAVTLVRLRS